MRYLVVRTYEVLTHSACKLSACTEDQFTELHPAVSHRRGIGDAAAQRVEGAKARQKLYPAHNG